MVRKSRKKDRQNKGINWRSTIIFSTAIGISVALFSLLFTKTFEVWLQSLGLHPDIAFFLNEFLKYFILALLITYLSFKIKERMKDKGDTSDIFI